MGRSKPHLVNTAYMTLLFNASPAVISCALPFSVICLFPARFTNSVMRSPNSESIMTPICLSVKSFKKDLSDSFPPGRAAPSFSIGTMPSLSRNHAAYAFMVFRSSSHVRRLSLPPVSDMSKTYRIPGFKALDGKIAMPLLPRLTYRPTIFHVSKSAISVALGLCL